MAQQNSQAYIAAKARALGLDPKAVAAVESMEGGSGRIGDGGHAFGPFQENNAGGVLTGRFPGASEQTLQNWAWSKAGINDALTRIARVASGLQGNAAVNAIVSRFERPLNPAAEIAGAEAHYGSGGGVSAPLRSSAPAKAAGPLQVLSSLGSGAAAPGGSSQLNQLLASYLLSSAQSGISGAQDSGDTLLAMAMARRALGGSQAPMQVPTAAQPKTAAPKAPARVTASAAPGGPAGGFLAKGASYTPGRLDQGHDFQTNPGAPIIAPGSGQVVAVKSDPNGFGPAYPVVHFTSGPYAGKDIYIGHTISSLQPGQKFTAGTVISHTGTTPIGNAQVPGWAEIGFAPGGLPGPDGQSVPFG